MNQTLIWIRLLLLLGLLGSSFTSKASLSVRQLPSLIITEDPQADDIFELILPKDPIQIELEHPQAFIFRTRLVDKDKEVFKIYLAKHTDDGHESSRGDEILSELGTWTVNAGVRDYAILWTPETSDGLPSNGGADYVLLVKRLSWWGWRKEVAYESPRITIVPISDSLVLQ